MTDLSYLNLYYKNFQAYISLYHTWDMIERGTSIVFGYAFEYYFIYFASINRRMFSRKEDKQNEKSFIIEDKTIIYTCASSTKF